MLHRTRQLFVRQRTTLINALRAHLAEFGIVAGVGRNGLERLLKVIEDGDDDRVPAAARDCLLALRDQLEMVKGQVLDADRHILAWHRSSEVSQRLDDIPGVGPLIATALVASVPDPHVFKSGRDLAAWIGLVPKQNSTGGKDRLGHISKAGNRLARVAIVEAARLWLRHQPDSALSQWFHDRTQGQKGRIRRIMIVALARKLAIALWRYLETGLIPEGAILKSRVR